MSRPKVALIYKKTGNLRAVQLLLGHATLDRTLRYLGVYIEDALYLSEEIDLSPLHRPSNSVSLSPRQPPSSMPFCVHDPVAVFVAPLATFREAGPEAARLKLLILVPRACELRGSDRCCRQG